MQESLLLRSSDSFLKFNSIVHERVTFVLMEF